MEEENAMKKNSGKRMNGKTKSIIALCIVAVLTIFFGRHEPDPRRPV